MVNNNGGMNRQGPRCSFCGKTQNAVERLVAGPNVYICNECVDLIKSMMDEENTPAPKKKTSRLPRPEEIKAELDQCQKDRAEKAKKGGA